MRGVGTTSGAVTVVNALPTGIGCALAVSLPVRAEIDLQPTDAPGPPRIHLDRKSESELVRETLRAGLARFAPGERFAGELRIESDVPPGKGLKSSSAVSGAVLRAIASALHQTRRPDELARMAADVAQQIGLSATGAYDDCLATLRGGLALADNSNRTPIHAEAFADDFRVLLWVPPTPHLPSTHWHARFRLEAGAGRQVVEAARAGRWAEAMTLNTSLVERVMGYDYDSLRANLLQRGASMCGVSGMGPTLAVLVPPPQVDAVERGLPTDEGEILRGQIRPAEGSFEETP